MLLRVWKAEFLAHPHVWEVGSGCWLRQLFMALCSKNTGNQAFRIIAWYFVLTSVSTVQQGVGVPRVCIIPSMDCIVCNVYFITLADFIIFTKLYRCHCTKTLKSYLIWFILSLYRELLQCSALIWQWSLWEWHLLKLNTMQLETPVLGQMM